jgi:hypothetical protein
VATPESKVKQRVKKILKAYEPELWCHWPVPGGYGKSVLDCEGCFRGLGFAIETKAAGVPPTPRQLATMREMRASGMKVFLIDGEKWPYHWLETWLQVTSLRPPRQ